MPAIGVAMTEGLLVRWVKRTGDSVSAGDILLEIETDKSVIEVDSPGTGTVGELLFREGDIVPTGVALTRILESGDDDTSPDIPEAGSGSAGTAVDIRSTPSAEPATAAPRTQGLATMDSQGQAVRAPHLLSPRQRRLARERSAEASEATVETAQDDHGASRTVPAGRHRALIAERVTRSWATIPHFAVSREVDASAMESVRDRYPTGSRPGFTDLLLRALALALRATGEPGGIDVGLAVATPQGVAIPVLRQILTVPLGQQIEATAAAVARAREGRLTPDDLVDPPRSTLSNLGPQGVDSFTGVIAMGQMTLLTVGRIRPRPSVIGNTLGIRSSAVVTLNVDHRRMDGDDAARLLLAFVNAVEDADVLTDQGLTQ